MFIYFKAIFKFLALTCLCFVLMAVYSFCLGFIVGAVDAVYSGFVDVPNMVMTENSFAAISIKLASIVLGFYALGEGVKRIIATTSKELANEA